MSESPSRYMVGVDVGGTHGSSLGDAAFVLAARLKFENEGELTC